MSFCYFSTVNFYIMRPLSSGDVWVAVAASLFAKKHCFSYQQITYSRTIEKMNKKVQAIDVPM